MAAYRSESLNVGKKIGEPVIGIELRGDTGRAQGRRHQPLLIDADDDVRAQPDDHLGVDARKIVYLRHAARAWNVLAELRDAGELAPCTKCAEILG